jgi:hypothetical protein
MLLLDRPMSGLPAPNAEGAALELQVALRPPGATVDDIVPLVGHSYLDTLRSRLVDAGYDISLLTEHPDTPPAVGPPVYGQLAVGDSATAANLQTPVVPPWLKATNLDPRLRVAAALGGEVVRQNQDRYLEEAWRQVGDVLAANSLRRRAEFSLAASATLHRKWIAQIPAADLVTSTAPVHARVFVGQNLTITGRLRQSPLPPSIASIEYRRVTRARGSLPGATAWRASVGPAVLAARSSEAQPLKVAVAIDTIDALDATSKVWGVAAAPAILARLDPSLNQAGMTATQVATQLDSMNTLTAVDFATAAQAQTHASSIETDGVLTAVGMHPIGHLQPGLIATTSVSPTAAAHPIAPVAPHPGAPVDTHHGGPTKPPLPPHPPLPPVVVHFPIPTQKASVLKQQMFDVAKVIIDRQIVASDPASLPETRLAGGFESLRQTIVAALDPAVTMVRMVNNRISALSEAQTETLDDIMTAPDLSEPTYNALAAISHDWLLPGIDALPAGTTTLVESNRTFISAFLVGMNHELARELLWREYPTDQRGTYSRQFWTHRNTGNPADQYDLKHPLHASPQLTLEQLGEQPGDVAAPLVLVVKGELVRRYPGMLVTAAKTKKSGPMRALDPATEIQPDFMARLEPDVFLVGFESLSTDEVRTLAGNEDTAWWFFFAEHFTEPRFGLDLLEGDAGAFADWNDATWANATLDAAGRLGAASFNVPPLPKSRPGTPPGPSFDWYGPSSSIAWILLQYPFRRGMRAVDLLPPEATP